MKIVKFKYKDKEREVIVGKEDDNYIEGVDLSYYEETQEKDILRVKALLTEPQSLDEFNKLLGNALTYYRNFRKDRFQTPAI
jgi:hypothetical protein